MIRQAGHWSRLHSLSGYSLPGSLCQRSTPMRLETIKIGRIVNAHGIRGEVRVQPEGQDPAFLTRFKTFYLDGACLLYTSSCV